MLSMLKIKAGLLSLLAVLLVGSAMTATASAEPGPFWHHRPIGAKEAGAKIEPTAPENFSGKGGRQTLQGSVSGLEVEIISPATQVKGAIFNAEHQGQIKIAIFYQPLEVKINGVSKPNCIGTVGQQSQFSNAIQLKGHLAWKWDGSKTQLEEQPQLAQKPDLVFTNVEPQEQTGRPLLDLRNSGVFAEINLKGTECGLAQGANKVGGSEVGIPDPSQVEEWSRKLTVRTIHAGQLPKEILGNEVKGEGFLQHIWVGNGYQPLIVGLTFAGNAANLIGQTEVETEQQEVAVFPS